MSALCITGQPPYSVLDIAETILAIPNREMFQHSNQIRKLSINLPRQRVENIIRKPLEQTYIQFDFPPNNMKQQRQVTL